MKKPQQNYIGFSNIGNGWKGRRGVGKGKGGERETKRWEKVGRGRVFRLTYSLVARVEKNR